MSGPNFPPGGYGNKPCTGTKDGKHEWFSEYETTDQYGRKVKFTVCTKCHKGP